MKILSTGFLAIVFCSCAIHVGTITGDAYISSNNFKMVGMADGTATTTKIFGIGGLGIEALVLEAKKDLLQNNPLREGQALANVSLDFKNSYVLFVNKQKATVAADIIEFYEQTPSQKNAKMSDNINPVVKEPAENQPNKDKEIDNKSDAKKSSDIKPDKISNATIPIENVPVPDVTRQQKEEVQTSPDKSSIPPPPLFEPTILYSAPGGIITSSGERFKVEAGDYFIGTLDEKGNPENGKLYGKNGRPKHVILPRRNH